MVMLYSCYNYRNHALSASEMVLLPLRFLACGCFLQTTGDMMGVDKSTASRTINKVTRAIARLATNIIKMPSTAEEIDENINFILINSPDV